MTATSAMFMVVLAVVVVMLGAVDAKAIWSRTPAMGSKLIRDAFPLGNGRMGALPFGLPGQEKLSLNLDSLWNGGPFDVPGYNGGNPTSTKVSSLYNIRSQVFQGRAGDVNDLLGSMNGYGSPRVLANLSIVIQGINMYTSYNRSLDLTTGTHTTTFVGNDRNTYTTVTYCSYPAKTCIYRISSTAQLPNVAVSLENRLISPASYTTSCSSSMVRLAGNTRGKGSGMEYDVIARLSTGPLGMPMSSCSTNAKGTLVVTGSAYGKELILNSFSVVVGAGTDYDAAKGNAANKFSFKGPKPALAVEKGTANMAVKLESKLYQAHIQDYQRLMTTFRLDLNDPWKGSKYPSETLDFFSLMDRYKFSYKSAYGGRRKKRAARNSKFRLGDSKLAQMAQPIAEHQTSYVPARIALQDKWENAAPQTPFPEFDFPTTLAKGVTHTAPIPWSTDGVITVTGENGVKQTVTLTSAPLPTITGESESEAEDANRTRKPESAQNSTGLVWEVDDSVTGSRAAQEILDSQQSQPVGDPYVESLLFDFARHLFICSSRDDSLPPTLQGRWINQIDTPESDYRNTVNFQMNYWFADQVGLADLQNSLFNFMKSTWRPRGRETARLVYDAPGWVVHGDMNIFGHSGLKARTSYPVAAAWMMQTVYDYWDYNRNLGWLQTVGYNLLREVSLFWASQLVPDQYTKDGSLVANPCNSPEKGPTTFGCAHFQQIIHQLFVNTLAAGYAVNDQNATLNKQLENAIAAMDKGMTKIGWGGVREFKLPENQNYDVINDKHRYLSHLVGWFPGYSISSFSGGYSDAKIQQSVATTPRSRGDGSSDGNHGWAKLWRAAAWARLNDTAQADRHLQFAISSNIGPNALNIGDGRAGPFQIDGNFGIAGAMLAMLVYDVPSQQERDGIRNVVLGPAIPARWGPGKVRGLRIRGGTIVDMEWDNRGVVSRLAVQTRGEPCSFYSRENKLIGRI